MTIHHLAFSRSFRVVWLCEELAIPYTLIAHEREAGMRAPAAFKALHPMGKAPVVVDGSMVMAESAVILTYLDQRAGGALSPRAGDPHYWRHAELFEFVEGAGMPPLMMTMLGRMTGGLSQTMWSAVRSERQRVLVRVEQALAGQPFLCGASMTLVDIHMGYLVGFADALGLLSGRAAILATYLASLASRAAFRRAERAAGAMVARLPRHGEPLLT